MTTKADVENARTRVIFALKALTDYVNRPPSVPKDAELFQRLTDEFRAAATAYKAMLAKLITDQDAHPLSPPSVAA
jgi:hypothetical protein